MRSFVFARLLAMAALACVAGAAATPFFYAWRISAAWVLGAFLLAYMARGEARSVRRYRDTERRIRRGNTRLMSSIRRMDTVRVFDPPTLEELEANWMGQLAYDEWMSELQRAKP